MIVLIGDNDEETHYEIRRAVLATLPCEILKAVSGPDVLHKLQHRVPDALIMDAELPILDSCEVLQVLRDSPRLANLPVFILAKGIGQALARRLLEYGVMDILLKPFAQARLDRLTDSLIRLATNRPRQAQPVSRLAKGSAALIVDGDKAFREYFTKAVGDRLTVVTAESGAQALEICHRTHADVVFLGTDMGLVSRAHVAQKLRRLPYGAVRIISIPQKSEAEADRASGLFDDVMMRTYAPASFERELGRWLRSTTPFERLNALVPDLRTQLIRAAEQVFGSMLGTDVEPVDAPPAAVETRAVASVTITPAPSAVTLRFCMGMEAGRSIAGAFLDTEPAALADDDVVAVAGEVANVLGGRMKVALEERDLEAVMGLPALTVQPESQACGLLPPEDGIDHYFQAIDRPIGFRIQLTVDSSDIVVTDDGVATIRAAA